MASERLNIVRREIASAMTAGSGLVDGICAAATSLLELRGAGISLMVDGQLRGTAGVVEPGVAAIQELQLSLGEGPCIDAWNTGLPVFEPDLSHPETVRWQVFARAAVEAGVLAVFAMPLRLGGIRIGVLALYRDRPGALDADELAYGLILADITTRAVLGLQAGVAKDAIHDSLAHEPVHWAEIHQATGMITVHLDVSLDEAFARLRSHAFAAGRPLRDVAAEVVSGRLRLRDHE